ncbi:MAG: Asp-tRNA(Asn)/Glu-tRNA(Gln) amidotransferase subunit GatB [Candidatus Omnitrophota bacterium]
MEYEAVIGLEVHLQLDTKTKAFCGCSTEFGAAPNSHTCPVCLGLPGSLPVLNRKAFLSAIKVALALDCEIQPFVKFDRKNYYYPDLPKNYQISQFDKPVSYDGHLEIVSGGRTKRIAIKRVHLEEDAGKLIHQADGCCSLVDLNRTGTPLLEIVTEPDLRSPEESYEYLTSLKSILEYLEVSDCDMEKGSLRCDANISIRKKGDTGLSDRVELKNMNSFKGARSALGYEFDRQIDALESGEPVRQETRLWNAEKEITVSMRTKEEARDYRYFPEPDLVPFEVDNETVAAIRRELPELPASKRARFIRDFGLSEYDAGALTAGKDVAAFFEECAGMYRETKTIANWLMGDIASQMNIRKAGIPELGIEPRSLAELLSMIDEGTISGKIAKDVLIDMIETKKAPRDIVESRGITQISDGDELGSIVREIVDANQKTVDDYKAGKKNALAFLVGQAMKRTKGRANPKSVNELLHKIIGA